MLSGIKIADINVAEGHKQSRVLNSEAYKSEQINQAFGEANAIIAKAEAKAKAIQLVADALARKVGAYLIIKHYSSMQQGSK